MQKRQEKYLGGSPKLHSTTSSGSCSMPISVQPGLKRQAKGMPSLCEEMEEEVVERGLSPQPLHYHGQKIAIFHDYFGAIGGGERVVLSMAHTLNADIITKEDTDALEDLETNARVISLGHTIHHPGLKQISAILNYLLCRKPR
jgi:hypothetical protein